LSCLISKTSGEAQIGGLEVGDPTSAFQIRRMIGLLPDSVGLYDELTAYQNLDFYGKLYDLTESQRKANIERFLTLLGVWDKRHLALGTFSKGMKQKIAIARALIHDPAVLLLDEPTANLDPEASKTVRDFILTMKSERKTILLCTHNLDEAQRICDRIGILKTRLVAIGPPKELERSVSASHIVVRLDRVNDAILDSLRSISAHVLSSDAAQVTIEVQDPGAESPRVVEAIVRAGGRIQSVTEVHPSLEETYLKFVR
jgi:ABC-2 type transport system ATP-binding protein